MAKKERKRKRAVKRSKKKLSNKKKRRQCGGNKDLAVQVKNKRIKTEFDLGVIKDDPVDEKKSMDKENIPPERGLLNKKQSVQMNTFIDRRVSAEEFLKSLEEKW